MFGRKKEERGAGPKDGRSGAESQQGYYRQEDYYTQRPSGGSYYDVNSYDGGRRERREYARPEYDRRYVNTPDGSSRRANDSGRPPQDQSVRGGYGPGGRGSAPRGYDPIQTPLRRMPSGRENVPYMEEGYGERIYDPADGADAGRTGRSEDTGRTDLCPALHGKTAAGKSGIVKTDIVREDTARRCTGREGAAGKSTQR